MSDIVERLRAMFWAEGAPMTTAHEAAGEIERLEAELQTIHAHLQHYRALVDGLHGRSAEQVAALRDARIWLSGIRSAIDDPTERAELELVMDRISAAIAKAEKP